MAQGSRSSRNELSRTINIHSPSKEMIIARTMSNSRQCPTLIRFHSIVVRLYHTLGFWSVQLVGFSLEQNTGSSVFQVGNQGCTRSSQLEMKIFLVAPCPGIGTPYPIFFRTRLIYCILDMSRLSKIPSFTAMDGCRHCTTRYYRLAMALASGNHPTIAVHRLGE